MTGRILYRGLFWVLILQILAACGTGDEESTGVRVMTYNIEDVRTPDLQRTDHPRLRQAAAVVQHLAPDVLLVNEISYDQAGGPAYNDGVPEGQNGDRFVQNYLSVAQADTLNGVSYEAVMLPVNTGVPSGFDLNNDGRAVTASPVVPSSPEDGSVPEQTEVGRAYGNDAWGFGLFPGQYGMALFVRNDLTVLRDSIRTFRLFRWSAMPDALQPMDSTSGEPWYADAAWEEMRLSSKSHWDVPVRLPNGSVLHVLASHPTPPAFDGPAQRNARRNHDEIRFWTDYVTGTDYVVDDSGRVGGLHQGARFVVVGDLNADPEDPSRFRDAVRALIRHSRTQGAVVPRASMDGQRAFPNLDPDDTARWGKRVDYVLPSSNLAVSGSGMWRPDPARDADAVQASDHFPVWIDVRTGP